MFGKTFLEFICFSSLYLFSKHVSYKVSRELETFVKLESLLPQRYFHDKLAQVMLWASFLKYQEDRSYCSLCILATCSKSFSVIGLTFNKVSLVVARFSEYSSHSNLDLLPLTPTRHASIMSYSFHLPIVIIWPNHWSDLILS